MDLPDHGGACQIEFIKTGINFDSTFMQQRPHSAVRHDRPFGLL